MEERVEVAQGIGNTDNTAAAEGLDIRNRDTVVVEAHKIEAAAETIEAVVVAVVSEGVAVVRMDIQGCPRLLEGIQVASTC